MSLSSSCVPCGLRWRAGTPSSLCQSLVHAWPWRQPVLRGTPPVAYVGPTRRGPTRSLRRKDLRAAAAPPVVTRTLMSTCAPASLGGRRPGPANLVRSSIAAERAPPSPLTSVDRCYGNSGNPRQLWRAKATVNASWIHHQASYMYMQLGKRLANYSVITHPEAERSKPRPPPGSVSREARVGMEGSAVTRAGRSVGRSDPKCVFARRVGRSAVPSRKRPLRI